MTMLNTRKYMTIRQERPSDAAAREVLLDVAYGPERFIKPSSRLRAGRNSARGLSLVAVDGGELVGTVRLWPIFVGWDRPALLLGPLAVRPDCRRRGIGSALMRRALREAARRGHAAVLLVGDAAYYGRFGFSADTARDLWLPGLVDHGRLLGCELVPGAFDGARGAIRTASRPAAAAAATLIAPAPKPQAA